VDVIAVVVIVNQRFQEAREVSVLPRGVRRVLEAMRTAGARELTASELAAIAGVSTRTLQRQFVTSLGKTPQAALRDIRFERARRELLRGSPQASVLDIALRCGFTHFGRFSVEYRRRYGEKPSQTLRRQAVLMDAQAPKPHILSSRHDHPTIAVLPIEAGPQSRDIARGVADEVMIALTRAGAAVTSHPASACYHLAGVLREDDRQARITLRLIEAATGRHIWAHRCDGDSKDAFFFQESIATKLVAAVQPCLRSAEIDRARRKPDAELTAHDLTLRALPNVLALDADGNARALDLLERAMDRDPHQPLAIALAAWSHGQRVVYHFTERPGEERDRAAALARRALLLDGDATVLTALGNALTALHDLETAELVIRKALAVDGSSAWAWSRSGWIDVYKGDTDSAIERFAIALDLAPHDPLAFNTFVGTGCAHFHAGRYVEAAYWQERALVARPSAAWVHRTLCPAYVLGGFKTDARRSLAALRGHYPELTVSQLPQGLPPLPPGYGDLVMGSLESMGLPP
jgi:AraC-like DNA-binding protein/tetratricopeptide (TPR) repeat protein